MTWYVHIDEESRINGIMPETVEDRRYDAEKMEYVTFERQNVDESCIAIGWFKWPFDEPIPENHYEYAIKDGQLVHIGPIPPSTEQLREKDVIEAHDDLPEIQEGLMEVARMSADHETSIEDLENAIIELAALIGGE